MYTIYNPSGTICKNGVAINLSDNSPEFQEYVAWLALGNGPTSLVDVEPPQVIVVTPWQMRKALNIVGLRDAVEAAVTASDNRDIKDGWGFATSFESTNPLILSMGTALGKSADDMYALFQLAATL